LPHSASALALTLMVTLAAPAPTENASGKDESEPLDLPYHTTKLA
jgi:hypothetical protein